MASAPVRGSIKARQGLGSLSASSHSTATGASQVSAKHSSRKLCQAGPFREQRFLVALAHPSSRSCEHSQHGNRGGVAGPLHVYAPAKEDCSTQRSSSSSSSSDSTTENYLSNNAVPATSLALEPEGHGQSITVSSSEILAPVRADMEQLTVNLKAVVGERSNLLKAAADQIFGAGGKKLRPAIVFMVSRATAKYAGLSEITEKHRRLAEITEMIHTASLMHDDVVDESPTRRGKMTVNSRFGAKVAVLAGDFLFAQSSWFLANLDNLEVIKLISQVIADFASGEISQQEYQFDTDITLQQYLDKSFYKTATLIAASCKSAAAFSDVPVEVKNAMFEYGRHLGLAFQIVDDILDFTTATEQLGKPQGQDLVSGNLTAPAVFALQHPQYGAELEGLIQNEFDGGSSFARALDLVHLGGGIQAARHLARQEADMALDALQCLPASPAKKSLEMMVDYVLDRLY
ncbi:hypothetical protein CVIRNUC_006245 [Coccomyxa viridis]|uniref:Solanesyl diphosphate synthase n=1 Tax=Coccomyxa viridis TaxID=1274662 RepID=A0AAV1IAJ3_9CHLO|nr:hypothetical protein CVIRNUC_006245 [Coccomyxa viridis]